MQKQRETSPHGGVEAAMEYVVDRIALASEINTTGQISAEETEALFARHLALAEYIRNNPRDSD